MMGHSVQWESGNGNNVVWQVRGGLEGNSTSANREEVMERSSGWTEGWMDGREESSRSLLEMFFSPVSSGALA